MILVRFPTSSDKPNVNNILAVTVTMGGKKGSWGRRNNNVIIFLIWLGRRERKKNNTNTQETRYELVYKNIKHLKVDTTMHVVKMHLLYQSKIK